MQPDTRPDRAGTFAGVVFILLGGWMLHESGEMSDLGSVFPRTIAVAMIVFSVILIATNLLRQSAGGRTEPAAAERSRPRAVLTIAVMLGWVLIMPVLGFFATSIIAFFILLFTAANEAFTLRRLALYTLVALALLGGFHIIFVHLLLIPLPTGILF